MQTFEIKSRWDGRVLYLAGGESLRDVVVRAVREGASLVDASLDGAYLDGASLDGASLVGASLVGASLDGASLDGASLDGASLDGASLRNAYLDGASLDGASLDGADGNKLTLAGRRPILILGPLGSRGDYLTAYTTDSGVYVRAGCFFDSLAAFRLAVSETHGDSIHGREYAAAIVMIEAHAAIWMPAPVAEAA